MAFLSPWFLLGALVAGLPILLHLFRREEAPSVRFPVVRFIAPAPVMRHARRKPQDLLLLALRVLALVLLAVAFARPFWAAEAATVSTTIVALDTSYSMSAPGRFDAARARAREELRGAPAVARVALVSFDDRARTVVEPTLDRAAVLAAADGMQPGARGTRYRAAVEHAATLLEGRPGRVVLVTDLQREGWAGSGAFVPTSMLVDVIDVGGPVQDLMVASVERTSEGISAAISNTGDRNRAAPVRLRIDGRAVAEQRVTVPPGATSTVRFAMSLPPSGVAAVAVEDTVGLPADNERFLLLDVPPPPTVLALAGGERGATHVFYLDRALEAVSDRARSGLGVVDARGAAALTQASLRAADAVLLVGTVGIDRRLGATLAEYVVAGGGLLVAAGPQLDAGLATSLLERLGVRLASAGASAFPTRLAPVDVRHPIFEPFGAAPGSLTRVRVERAVRIETRAGARTLAQFGNGLPALVEVSAGAGRVLVFASDLNQDWNDFPLQPAFVPFVHQVVRYLARADAVPRELLMRDVPPEVAPQAGVWPAGPRKRRIAVNVDIAEAADDRLTREEFAKRIRRVPPDETAAWATARRAEADQGAWRYFVLAAVFVLASEMLVGRRGRKAGVSGYEGGTQKGDEIRGQGLGARG